MAFDYEEIITEKEESIDRLESMLYNAILCWYDDALEEYNGLDDENFVHRVCKKTGLTRAEYEDLINGNTEECSWNQ